MKNGLLTKLELLKSAASLSCQTGNEIEQWNEEIRIMLELKKLGCGKVFDGLNIDDQIRERQHLIRVMTASHRRTLN
jgi:hypothetical protein